ncbi:MAG: bacterio-opsin activator domain-containing protein [Salinigranum sp.]
MSVITNLHVPARDFVLGEALTSNPGVRVSLERVVPIGDSFVPYFWASNNSLVDIEDAIGRVDGVESFEVVDSIDSEALIKVVWKEGPNGLFDSLAESGGTLLEATGESERWSLQVRFENREDLTAFYRSCVDRGISLELTGVHNPGLLDEVGLGFALTDTQRETLVAALEAGYFDVPRRTNLVELADRMGVSDTAVSQRIRRGVATLLRATLTESNEDEKR